MRDQLGTLMNASWTPCDGDREGGIVPAPGRTVDRSPVARTPSSTVGSRSVPSRTCCPVRDACRGCDAQRVVVGAIVPVSKRSTSVILQLNEPSTVVTEFAVQVAVPPALTLGTMSLPLPTSVPFCRKLTEIV